MNLKRDGEIYVGNAYLRPKAQKTFCAKRRKKCTIGKRESYLTR